MAVPTNIILDADIDGSLSREFINNFDGSFSRLAEFMGIFGVNVRPAGTALYQYTVAGALNNSANAAGAYFKTADTDIVAGKTYYTVSEGVYSAVASPSKANLASYYELNILGSSSGTAYIEGDEVALSKYTVTKTPIGDLSPIPYRKMTSAKAILQDGYVKAVLDTDNKMLSQIRAQIINQLFTFLATGTGAPAAGVSVTNLQKALAYGDAALENAMETNGDTADGAFVHFVSRNDAADYLATANISTQTLFGLTYIENFLGVERVFLTNKVTDGTVIVTPSENIKAYGIDFGELADGGLVYATSDNGLIGVAHKGAYDHASAETDVMTGLQLVPEKLDYIVKSTISA
jgi:hypothetical protein